MIIDRIDNIDFYFGLNDKIKRAGFYLKDTKLNMIKPGRYTIEDDKLYALVQSYETINIDQGRWEGHRRYIDLQYIVEGIELMGYANINNMNIASEYDKTKDILFFNGEGDYFTVNKGYFVLFTPNDIHKPCLTGSKPNKVKKVVIKILI